MKKSDASLKKFAIDGIVPFGTRLAVDPASMYIKTKQEYDELLQRSKDEDFALLIDFDAAWCPPCKRIGPIFNGFSLHCDPRKILLKKVDVDENSEAAQAAKIQAMPTF